MVLVSGRLKFLLMAGEGKIYVLITSYIIISLYTLETGMHIWVLHVRKLNISLIKKQGHEQAHGDSKEFCQHVPHNATRHRVVYL